jgi:hypothetical protein
MGSVIGLTAICFCNSTTSSTTEDSTSAENQLSSAIDFLDRGVLTPASGKDPDYV